MVYSKLMVVAIVFLSIGFPAADCRAWLGETIQGEGHSRPADDGDAREVGADEPRAGDLWLAPQSGIRFRLVPAGTFDMGSPADEVGRGDDEVQHQVTLTRSFWMAEKEVTQAQWQAVTGDNSSLFSSCGGDCPVESVSWLEAVLFANALSAQEALPQCYEVEDSEVTFRGLDCAGFRLPTEAEWELAARSGSDTALYTGGLTIVGLANAAELDPIAWYGGNSGLPSEDGIDCSGWRETQQPARFCGTHPVGGKLPNQWQLYDMIGGVWEWTQDWYSSYSTSPAIDPEGPSEGAARVARGCGWDSAAKACRAANRSSNSPGTRYPYLGLRVVRTAEQ